MATLDDASARAGVVERNFELQRICYCLGRPRRAVFFYAGRRKERRNSGKALPLAP